jgi:hypothetical protein
MKQILALAFVMIGFGLAAGREINLVQNPGFEALGPSTQLPVAYEVKGAAFWGRLGSDLDFATNGIIFPGNAPQGGSVSQKIAGIDQAKGRWISFRFRGRAEDCFSVPNDTLTMKRRVRFTAKSRRTGRTSPLTAIISGAAPPSGAATSWRNSCLSRKSTRSGSSSPTTMASRRARPTRRSSSTIFRSCSVRIR